MYLPTCKVLRTPQGFGVRSRISPSTSRNKARRVMGVSFKTKDQVEGVAEVATAPAVEQQEFNWFEQWYPLAVEAHLDDRKPFKTPILGKDVVLWRDGTGDWKCVLDRCPHRAAPLSEGRIEPSDRTLQCSYHGWRFDGNGKAVAIPQSAYDSPEAEKSACSNRRSCVPSFPVKVADGLVWVWPTSGPEAFINSSMVNANFRPIDHASLTVTWNFYVRDFPVPYDILLENISDQSHVPFAHHNVAHSRGSKYSNHFNVSHVNKDLKESGRLHGYTYDLEWSPDPNSPPITQKVQFAPPTFIEYLSDNEAEGKGISATWFHVVPLTEHSTRVFVHNASTQPLPAPLQLIVRAVPPWMLHVLLNTIFDGDMAYLYTAAINAASTAPGRPEPPSGPPKVYYLPATADRPVVAFRSWFHGKGRHGHTRSLRKVPEPSPPVSREQCLERFHQHTEQCPSCRKTLAGVRAGQQVLKVLAGALLFIAAEKGGLPMEQAPWIAGAVTALGASWGLNKFEDVFIYTGYEHWKS